MGDKLRKVVREKFQGVSPHRYGDNPLELLFSQHWQDLNSRPTTTTLDYLMDRENRGLPDPPLTDREWRVANTVVQWLGSPVGFGFLREVLGPHVRKCLVKALKEEEVDVDVLLDAIFKLPMPGGAR